MDWLSAQKSELRHLSHRQTGDFWMDVILEEPFSESSIASFNWKKIPLE
jgi:hypothetical protein